MKKLFICIVMILVAVVIMRGYWQRSAKEAVAFTEDNELYVEAGDVDAYFELLEPFSETYMFFGATPTTYKEAFNEFWLHAISMADLRPIYRELRVRREVLLPAAVLRVVALARLATLVFAAVFFVVLPAFTTSLFIAASTSSAEMIPTALRPLRTMMRWM